MDIKLELRVEALEKSAKQAACDIRYLKETNKELAQRNKDYLAAIKKHKDPATQARTIKAKTRETKKYVKALEEAAKITE
jgi:hypothetical protein